MESMHADNNGLTMPCFRKFKEVKSSHGNHKVLKFFLIDDTGKEHLAAVGEETADAHYNYRSQPEFENYGNVHGHCRKQLLMWLEQVIKESHAAGPVDADTIPHVGDPTPTEPFGTYFINFRQHRETLPDGRHVNKFWLTDQHGVEHLAVVGSERETRDAHYTYHATDEFAVKYPLDCNNQDHVVQWLEALITRHPPTAQDEAAAAVAAAAKIMDTEEAAGGNDIAAATGQEEQETMDVAAMDIDGGPDGDGSVPPEDLSSIPHLVTIASGPPTANTPALLQNGMIPTPAGPADSTSPAATAATGVTGDGLDYAVPPVSGSDPPGHQHMAHPYDSPVHQDRSQQEGSHHAAGSQQTAGSQQEGPQQARSQQDRSQQEGSQQARSQKAEGSQVGRDNTVPEEGDDMLESQQGEDQQQAAVSRQAELQQDVDMTEKPTTPAAPTNATPQLTPTSTSPIAFPSAVTASPQHTPGLTMRPSLVSQSQLEEQETPSIRPKKLMEPQSVMTIQATPISTDAPATAEPGTTGAGPHASTSIDTPQEQSTPVTIGATLLPAPPQQQQHQHALVESSTQQQAQQHEQSKPSSATPPAATGSAAAGGDTSLTPAGPAAAVTPEPATSQQPQPTTSAITSVNTAVTAPGTTATPAAPGTTTSRPPRPHKTGSKAGHAGPKASGSKHKLVGVAQDAHMKRLRRLAQESEESVRAAQEAHLTVLRKAAVVETQARDALRRGVAHWVRSSVSEDEQGVMDQWLLHLKTLLNTANKEVLQQVPYTMFAIDPPLNDQQRLSRLHQEASMQLPPEPAAAAAQDQEDSDEDMMGGNQGADETRERSRGLNTVSPSPMPDTHNDGASHRQATGHEPTPAAQDVVDTHMDGTGQAQAASAQGENAAKSAPSVAGADGGATPSGGLVQTGQDVEGTQERSKPTQPMAQQVDASARAQSPSPASLTNGMGASTSGAAAGPATAPSHRSTMSPSPAPQSAPGVSVSPAAHPSSIPPPSLPSLPTPPADGTGLQRHGPVLVPTWTYADPHHNKHGVRVILECLREVAALMPPMQALVQSDLIETVTAYAQRHPHPGVQRLARHVLGIWQRAVLTRLKCLASPTLLEDPCSQLEARIAYAQIEYPPGLAERIQSLQSQQDAMGGGVAGPSKAAPPVVTSSGAAGLPPPPGLTINISPSSPPRAAADPAAAAANIIRQDSAGQQQQGQQEPTVLALPSAQMQYPALDAQQGAQHAQQQGFQPIPSPGANLDLSALLSAANKSGLTHITPQLLLQAAAHAADPTHRDILKMAAGLLAKKQQQQALAAQMQMAAAAAAATAAFQPSFMPPTATSLFNQAQPQQQQPQASPSMGMFVLPANNTSNHAMFPGSNTSDMGNGEPVGAHANQPSNNNNHHNNVTTPSALPGSPLTGLLGSMQQQNNRASVSPGSNKATLPAPSLWSIQMAAAGAPTLQPQQKSHAASAGLGLSQAQGVVPPFGGPSQGGVQQQPSTQPGLGLQLGLGNMTSTSQAVSLQQQQQVHAMDTGT